MRGYFATIGDSAHPGHEDPRVRAITNFQELLGMSIRFLCGVSSSEGADRHISAISRRLPGVLCHHGRDNPNRTHSLPIRHRRRDRIFLQESGRQKPQDDWQVQQGPDQQWVIV